MATIDDYESGSDEEDYMGIGGNADTTTTIDINADEENMDEETDYTVPPMNIYNADADDATDAILNGGNGDEDDVPPPNADIEKDEDIDEDDVDLSDKYRKLKSASNLDVLKQSHPECIAVNYQEIDALTTIVYDDRKNIVDPLHITLPLLDKYEKARIIGLRAIQLDNGARPFINVDPKMIIDSKLIAEEELKQKKLPFIIKRPLPNGGAEFWKVADLEDVRN